MPNLDEIKRQLEERLGQLSARAAEIEGELRTPRSADWEEQATEVEGDEVAGALEGTLLSEIEEIESALKRIAEGTYGECATCGREIGEKRMEALPFAVQCIDCAKEQESS
jgi:RNA polymerase-binding transcription factor DksA